MSEKVSEKEVRHVAALARLTLAPDEVARMQRDLSSILGYVEKLSELDTKDTPPTAHAVELPTKFRSDDPRPGLPVEKSLANAPERLGDGFGVPKIIE
jgi:aspartyl-tRNA(Asn)/glutamyl-tRNA(Gln) amidotransferase subunit C